MIGNFWTVTPNNSVQFNSKSLENVTEILVTGDEGVEETNKFASNSSHLIQVKCCGEAGKPM